MRDLRDVHRDLLERWRHITNLVGPGPVDEHFQDCERALGWLRPSGRWVDLGSGAGFPGLVLAAMAPQVNLDLVDSRSRRCAFLERVLVEAQVAPDRVRVRCERVEQLPDAAWDGLVARAFAPPEAVLEHAARLLRPGGTVVLFLQEDATVPEDDRYDVFHVEHYTVGGKARKAAGLRLRA